MPYITPDVASIDQVQRFAEIVAAITTPNSPDNEGALVHMEFLNAQSIPAGWSFYSDPSPSDWIVATTTIDPDGSDHCCTTVVDYSGTVRESLEQN